MHATLKKDSAAEEKTAAPAVEAPRTFPEHAVYGTQDWDEERFVRWHRSNAVTYKLTPRSPELLRSFGASVISKLGRIPRRELLERLLDSHAELHAVKREAEAAEREGRISRYEAENRIAPARAAYSDRLYHELAYSDYSFLTREWADDKNPYYALRHKEPPRGSRPRGAQPYEIRVESEQTFVAWYRAYGPGLKLPRYNRDHLGEFYRDIVRPLGHLPQPKLMRTLQTHYAVYRKTRELADNNAEAVLSRALRSALSPIDYDRVRGSEE